MNLKKKVKEITQWNKSCRKLKKSKSKRRRWSQGEEVYVNLNYYVITQYNKGIEKKIIVSKTAHNGKSTINYYSTTYTTEEEK